MELAVKAAGWVVGKALAPVTDGLLEAWAASNGLGPNVDALKVELLYAQAMLDNAHDREIRSPALRQLLNKLRQLAYNADDVLDELEYFRIQDALDGTYHAAYAPDGGCINGLVLNARHTAGAVVTKLKPSSGSREHHDEQDDVAKRGCLCGDICPGAQDDQNMANGDGNGRESFGAVASKVQGCLSGACLCGKREMSSSPPSLTSQRDKKVGCGCLLKVTSPACCNTAKSIGKRLLSCSFQSVEGNAHTRMLENREQRFLCGARGSRVQRTKNTAQETKLKFNRVDISAKMKDITEHLKPVCAKVSNILNLEFMGTNRITRKDIAKKRPITTSEITEDKLYGRGTQKKKIVEGITHGEYFSNELVVLPIVGPGGIGKTTFTRHVCNEVKSHFDAYIWVCVSLNLNASKLAQEAAKQIPRVDGEKGNSSDLELIEQRLKAKRFLLVLDDMWTYDDYEWKKLLAPFGRGGQKGSLVIVTTRIPEVARNIKTVDCWIELERLEREDFKCFFETCIFGGQKPWEGDTEKLCDVGEKIVSKLKRFPLEAKTVGRLLRNQLTLEHWTKVLESKEWELQTNEDDIMPALKLSYDYLPFHLQQCFYYCALFPEDYEFKSKELVHFWIGLDILHPSDLNRRIEDVGMGYLDDLVNHGFFKKNEMNGSCPVYVIHDLLHNLAVKISSFECLGINSSNVKSVHIPQDVRHLSIIVDNKDVEDIKTFKYYKNDLAALDKRLKVENLRTVMVFGKHHGSFVKIFCDLFEKARALRAIYLSGSSFYVAPYSMEDMLRNFSKLIHLRYLKIKSINMENTGLLSALSRLYHLEVIDLHQWETCSGFSRHMNNLAKLRHFLVPGNKLQLHSNIIEVGKMKLLQELRDFEVGKKSKGFELSQLGKLSELGGSVAIRGLERIQTMEEASEARLIQLKRLRKLTLEWDANRSKIDTTNEENALEILVPHSNLQDLCIRGHGGTKCPQWLGENLSVKNLESLHLDGLAWYTFPPIGELWLVNELHEEISSNSCNKKFQNLRRLELVKLPRLKKWVVDSPCQLFAHLEVLIIKYCSKLSKLSFAQSACCHQEKDKVGNMNWFSSLQELEIEKCPELLSFPPIPWTSVPCSARISGIASGSYNLVCENNYKSEYSLNIKGTISLDLSETERVQMDIKELVCEENYRAENILENEGTVALLDGTFWNGLAFGNLTKLEELKIDRCPPLPLHHLHMLSSLKTLELRNSSGIAFPLTDGESHALYQFPAERVTIDDANISSGELTHLLTYFPKLSELEVQQCNKITLLGVMEKQATATPAPSPSASKVDVARIEQHQQQDGTRREEEIAAEAQGLLLVPSQLQKLRICDCPELILHSDPVNDNREAGGRTGGGQGLQGLTSLRSLTINGCPRFLSSYSSSSPFFPFPASLEHLEIVSPVGTATLPPSNLTSLSDLTIGCEDLRGEGLRPLLAQSRVAKSSDRDTPNSFAGSESSPPHQPELPSYSSKLQRLATDEVVGVLAKPVCSFLSASLTELDFWELKEVDRFTKEQEEALQLLTSLESIRFCWCNKLQCLPAGLHRLPNLNKLDILYCAGIRSLPKDGLPSSLQELGISYCSSIRSIPKEYLPNSLQKLEIRYCPAIRSLPKVDDLPSSLRELDVSAGNSEELRRQCRKLIGTIPIVRDSD